MFQCCTSPPLSNEMIYVFLHTLVRSTLLSDNYCCGIIESKSNFFLLPILDMINLIADTLHLMLLCDGMAIGLTT